MTIKLNNTLLTANEMAKLLIDDELDKLLVTWKDSELVDIDKLTTKEKEEIKRHLVKHVDAMYKQLGIHKVLMKATAISTLHSA